ncbi:MAG: MYXO-CTERM sorting domain-containing protein [Pseudomonadota bacterium]
MKMPKSRLVFVATLFLPVFFPGFGFAEQITESFNTSVTVTHGTAFGDCGQLVAGVSGNATITVGNSQAVLTAPASTDSVLLASRYSLPAEPYKIRVDFSNYNFAYQTGQSETSAVMAGIYDIVPVPQTAAYWHNHALVEVSTGSDEEGASIYVGYWNPNGQGFTWNGTQWQAAWGAASPLEPSSAYSVVIERTLTDFRVSVMRGTDVVVETTPIPLADIQGLASNTYFYVGDGLTTTGYGTGVINEIELPKPSSCGQPADTSVVDSGIHDMPSQSDSVSAWDLSLVPNPPRPEEGCGCELATSAPWGTGVAFLMFALLWVLRRRR